jgi:hypothetical protein
MTRAKRNIGAIGATIVLIGAGVLAWTLWPARLPPMDAPTVELVKFVPTDAFEALPDAKKIAYVRELLGRGLPALALAAEEAKLTEAQRQRGIDNATQAGINVRMGGHLDAWLKLDAKGKKDYIHKIVAENPARPPGPGQRPGQRGRGMTADQVKRFIENTSPDRRAAMAEFMAAVRNERDAAAGKR